MLATAAADAELGDFHDELDDELEREALAALAEQEELEATQAAERAEAPTAEAGATDHDVAMEDPNAEYAEDAGDAAGEQEPASVRRPRINRPTLDSKRLLDSQVGLGQIAATFPAIDFKFERGSESRDFRKLMDHYEVWLHIIMPSMSLEDTADRTEKLGHQKPIREFLTKLRIEFARELQEKEEEEQREQEAEEAVAMYGDDDFGDDVDAMDEGSDDASDDNDGVSGDQTADGTKRGRKLRRNRVGSGSSAEDGDSSDEDDTIDNDPS